MVYSNIQWRYIIALHKCDNKQKLADKNMNII